MRISLRVAGRGILGAVLFVGLVGTLGVLILVVGPALLP